MVLFPKRDHIGKGRVEKSISRRPIGRPYTYYPLWLLVWQGAKENPVNDAENGCVCADAQRKGPYHDRNERGFLPKGS